MNDIHNTSPVDPPGKAEYPTEDSIFAYTEPELALMRAAVVSADQTIAAATFRLLNHPEYPDRLAFLCEALHAKSIIVASQAIESIEQYGEEAVEPLVMLLKEGPLLLKLEIVGALGRIGCLRVSKPLQEMLTMTISPSLRYTIIEALGNLGDLSAIDAIRLYADDPDYHVRERTTIALAKLNDRLMGQNVKRESNHDAR